MVVEALSESKLSVSAVDPAGAVTVTALELVKLPSLVVAVMVAEPLLIALTRPFASTLAIEGALEDQATVGSEALAGLTVLLSCPD